MKRYNADAYSGMKANGFTLIELVIVIVILGILSATAVPKFMNMQGDARASTLIAIKGAVKSANSMIYAKSLTNNINNSSSKSINGGINVTINNAKLDTDADIERFSEQLADTIIRKGMEWG